MKKLSYKEIRTWLTKIGMLQTTTVVSGKQRIVPTENGVQLGITLEERVGEHGTYHVTVYNRHAQQFFVDNLDAIIKQLR